RVVDRPQEDATSEAPVRFVPLTGARIRVTVVAVRDVRTKDYYSEQPITLPIGIAELGVPGARVTLPAGSLPGGCRTALLTVDGAPVPIVAAGDAALADGRGPLTVAGCGPPLALGPGDHIVRTRPGRDTGIDLDRLVLSSPGRVPAPSPADLHGPAAASTPAPRVRVVRQTPTSLSLP